jgi:hypothetical protein
MSFPNLDQDFVALVRMFRKILRIVGIVDCRKMYLFFVCGSVCGFGT